MSDPFDRTLFARGGEDHVADGERFHRDLAALGRDVGPGAIAGRDISAVSGFEHNAVGFWIAAVGRRSKKIACAVGDQAGIGIGAVGEIIVGAIEGANDCRRAGVAGRAARVRSDLKTTP